MFSSSQPLSHFYWLQCYQGTFFRALSEIFFFVFQDFGQIPYSANIAIYKSEGLSFHCTTCFGESFFFCFFALSERQYNVLTVKFDSIEYIMTCVYNRINHYGISQLFNSIYLSIHQSKFHPPINRSIKIHFSSVPIKQRKKKLRIEFGALVVFGESLPKQILIKIEPLTNFEKIIDYRTSQTIQHNILFINQFFTYCYALYFTNI